MSVFVFSLEQMYLNLKNGSDFFILYFILILFFVLEKIRKLITMNYRNILDEMQTPLARETLSKCNGNVNEIKEVLCDGCKSRRERMNIFLRFILHDDHNVVEFAKVLRKNGLKELLSSKGRRQRENMSDQGIGNI